MKKQIIYIFILLGITAQMSCETDANIPIPKQDPKYVLTAFINPASDSQMFTLTMSDPIFDGSNIDFNSYISDAEVKITDGNNTVTLDYNNSFNAYMLLNSSMNLDYNSNYTVSVSRNGKNLQTDFKTIGSAPIVINEIKIDSITKSDEFGFLTKTYFANVKWQDPASENNYYCLELFGLITDFTGNTVRVPLSDYYGNIYISDEGKNGTEMSRTLETYTSFFGEFGQQYKGFDVVISKTDEHYYRYFKSLQNYVGDDPFSEPSLVYTNINSGLGVIGNYIPYSIRKEL